MNAHNRETDTRVAYGTRCFWWGDIQEVGQTPAADLVINGRTVRGVALPCCPRCGSMLFEAENEAAFLAGAQKYEDEGHPGYVAFVLWSKGQCFPSLVAAQDAYAKATTEH
jgi:hypothetical protein